MKPIIIKIHGNTQSSPQEICASLLDTNQWTAFKGYSILPGIAHAEFEKRTPEVTGSRIRVRNTDGTAHVEEILSWDPASKVVLRFQEFTPPLRNLAKEFIETWEFQTSANGTATTRTMAMTPKNIFGWLVLLPISRLMKKAFEANRDQLG